MIDCMTVTLNIPVQRLYHAEVSGFMARDENGSFGVLPNHADFTTALVPSVIIFSARDETEVIFGIDEGILVKRGEEVMISVRRAVTGTDLDDLSAVVRRHFVEMDEQERHARAALSRLEADMVRRFAELKDIV